MARVIVVQIIRSLRIAAPLMMKMILMMVLAVTGVVAVAVKVVVVAAVAMMVAVAVAMVVVAGAVVLAGVVAPLPPAGGSANRFGFVNPGLVSSLKASGGSGHGPLYYSTPHALHCYCKVYRPSLQLCLMTRSAPPQLQDHGTRTLVHALHLRLAVRRVPSLRDMRYERDTQHIKSGSSMACSAAANVHWINYPTATPCP
nr:unnamed protein product [Digitaria exilis]